jgi:tetratricopeptide (TPR) repeat protein
MMRIKETFRQVISLFLMTGLALTQVGCQPVCQKLEPLLPCPPPLHLISNLPSAFPGLSDEELQQEWAKELVMGDVFAREWDLYRAITCYKRALILLPSQEIQRHLQLDYDLILCYYLGSKFQEAINIFENSELSQADPRFPAFNSLLLIIYDAYQQIHQEEKADCVLEVIQQFSPDTKEDLTLYRDFKRGDLEAIRCTIAHHRAAEELTTDFSVYDQHAKSPRLARALNAVLPGAGYYYVGQKRSALTCFIINALFIAASYQFFQRGYPAAGAITASMEMGWYFGGINGAGIAAHELNTRLYENVGCKILSEHESFPLLMFETSF